MNKQFLDKIMNLPIKVMAQLLKNYDYQHFALNDSPITDQEYDALESAYLRRIEIEDVEIPYVPGTVDYKIRQVPHIIPMGSLNRVYDNDGLLKWLGKYEPFTLINWSLKLDGIAYSATYLNGKLLNVLTRGKKIAGEDITVVLKDLSDIPLEIAIDGQVIIRGEIFITNKDFKAISGNLTDKYPTARHLTAGIIASGKSHGAKLLCSVCKIYIDGEIGKSLQKDIIDLCSKTTFIYNKYSVSHVSEVPDIIEGYITELLKNGHEWPFDGVVLSTEGYSGVPSKSWNKPRDLLAYKLPSARTETEILSLSYDVKQNGQIIVKGLIRPVKVGPVIAATANLHNTNIVEFHNYYPGKKVFAELTGDAVITIKPMKDAPMVDRVNIKQCPYCEGKLRYVANMAFCINAADADERPACIGAHHIMINRFFSSTGINLTGVGPVQLREIAVTNPFMMPSDIIRELLRRNEVGLNVALLTDLDARTTRSIVYGFGSLPLKYTDADAKKFYDHLPAYVRSEINALTVYSDKLKTLIKRAGS